MSLVPSPLNPIHFFGKDEPIFWRVNKYGADRGNYLRKYPVGAYFHIYVESTTVPNGAISLCDGSANVVTFGFTLVSGNTYHASQSMPFIPAFTPVYILIYGSADYLIFAPAAPTSLSMVTFAVWQGAQIRVTNPTLLISAEIQVNIPVAMAGGIEIGVFRVDPYNRLKLTQTLSFVDNTLIGLTGDHSLNLIVNNNLSSHGYNVDDYYTIMVRPAVNGEQFNLRFSQPANAYETSYLLFHVASTKKTEAYDVGQPAIFVTGRDAVVSELMDTRFNLNNSSYTQQMFTKITTQNVKAYLGIPANVMLTNWVLADFWKRSFQANTEDIETRPGEFTRLTSEAFRDKNFVTSFVPPYTHYQLQLQFGCDNLKIDDVDYIQRSGNNYLYELPNHYQLSKGSVMLTERKSITRNTI